jgi:hypothetical protein
LLTDQYQKFIYGLLSKNGFMAGTEIISGLQEKFPLSNSYARKILQRTTDAGLIGSSKPATFGKGQFIYMLPDQKIDIDNIKLILQKYRPPLYRIVDVMKQNGGIVSYYEALKLSASPEEKTTTKASTVNELIHTLVTLDLVKIETDSNNVRYIIDKNNNDIELVTRNHYSRMVLDSMFIPDILKWLRNVNIIDNLKTVYRSKQTPAKGAVHNSLAWDAYGYTKNTGINEIAGKNANTIEKQTLVVLDVLLSREYSQSDLDGCLGRVQVNLNSVKEGRRKVMPIVFYKEISPRVQNTLASLGFLSFDIGTVFGNKIKSIVDKIAGFQTLLETHPKKAQSHTVDSLLSTIRDAGQEENLSNLKGILFEFLLYPVLRTIYSNATVTHGKYYSKKNDAGDKEGYEYDFIIHSENPKEIVIVEAKGYSSESRIPIGDSKTNNTLSWFYGRTLPFIKSFFSKEVGEGYRFKACYITSSGFFEDGHAYLIAQGKLKPNKLLGYYDGNALLELLEENDFHQIKKTVQKYYLKKHNSETE